MKDSLIIRDVIASHKIHAEDFFGLSRAKHLVAARKDAAKRLREAGFMPSIIAMVMKRDVTTIRYYLDPAFQMRKVKFKADNWHLQWLDPDAREVVKQYAIASGTCPRIIIAQWVGERARFESLAKRIAA